MNVIDYTLGGGTSEESRWLPEETQNCGVIWRSVHIAMLPAALGCPKISNRLAQP